MLCTPLGEALAVFGTAAIKKIISMAAWGGIIFFIAMRWWLFNIMCLIGFFSEHACMSRAKNTIRPHYVNIASGSFFGVAFCFVALTALVYFFANTFYQ